MNEEMKMLKELSEVNGISGSEKEVVKVFRKYAEPYASRIEYDKLGSSIAYHQGKEGEPVVMIAGHMDEVGFLVARIEDNGMLRLHPIGGWWNHVVLAEVMTVTTRSGKEYIGVTGAQPPHGLPAEARAKVLETKDLYLDLGVKDAKAIAELGIRIGDTVTPKTDFRVLNDGKTLLGKAWDDRIGVAVALEVLKNLHGVDTDATIASCGTVQEEVGLRGARTCAYHVKPDIAFALDVTMSYDLPGSPKLDTKLGNGVALSVCDGSVIGHRGLFDFVEDIAKKHHVRYTYDMLTAGGTDSGEIHKQYDGIITMTISLPCRYFHSHVSLIDIDDFHEAVKLLTEVCKAINKKTLEDLKASKYQ